MRRASLLTGLATATILVFPTACGGTSGPNPAGNAGGPGAQTPSASTAAPTLRISGFSFGQPLTVRPGQKIRVVNADGAPHTVTADTGNAFDVSVEGGSSATLTAPTKPGRYPFRCTIHPTMQGTLIVAG